MINDVYTYKDSFHKNENVISKCIVKGGIEDPFLSIFIPTYKRVDTLRETIYSAITQNCDTEYEVVIVSNDPCAEDDEVKKLVEEFNDIHIYFFVNSENIGPCGNWNRGIILSRGKYICMIHDDDILSPWYISSIVKAINEQNAPSIIGVSYFCFNSKHIPEFRKADKLVYRKITKKSFFFGRYINIAGMAVNKEFITMIGGYQEEYHPCFDTYMIFQGVIYGKVINIEHKLAGYRKEYNDSLSETTMINVVYKIDSLRKNIAEKETFAKIFLFFFGREFLYSYIIGANKTWGLNLNPNEIMAECGYSTKKVNRVKTKIMNCLVRIIGRIG